MPTRWVIRGLSGIVDTIDGCSCTEMAMLAKGQGIDVWKCNRKKAIKLLKKAGLIWEEKTSLEVMAKEEEIRRHYLGDTIPSKRKRGAGWLILLLLSYLKRILNRRITIIWQ